MSPPLVPFQCSNSTARVNSIHADTASGDNPVGVISAALRAAKPQLGQRRVAANGLYDPLKVGVSLVAAGVAEHQHTNVAVRCVVRAAGRPLSHRTRLQRLKDCYDPNNFFCHNQNIPPRANHGRRHF